MSACWLTGLRILNNQEILKCLNNMLQRWSSSLVFLLLGWCQPVMSWFVPKRFDVSTLRILEFYFQLRYFHDVLLKRFSFEQFGSRTLTLSWRKLSYSTCLTFLVAIAGYNKQGYTCGTTGKAHWECEWITFLSLYNLNGETFWLIKNRYNLLFSPWRLWLTWWEDHITWMH